MDVLGIFAKDPAPGRVKTRLAAATSATLAAKVAEAFLSDTLERCSQVGQQRFLVYAPTSSRAAFAERAGSCYQLEAQAEGDLGNRLAVFLNKHVAAGHHVVALGGDSPTLPPALVLQAFDLLNQSDIVIGPATDGGYYLIGCARACPPAFVDIPWGGPEVLSATMERVQQAGLRLGLLPPWYDVDTLADLHLLWGRLQAMRRAGIDPQTPRTESVLAGWRRSE